MNPIDVYHIYMNDNNINLARLDLNLLTALHALLTHASVSAAGESVGRTQSAMSHSLSRLREHFQDPLLVREGWAMTLTPYAESLLPQVLQVSNALANLFEGLQPFNPESSTRTIRIATRDICVPLLTPLVAEIGKAGPGITVDILETASIREAVASMQADIGFGFGTDKAPANLDVRKVAELTWCVFAPKKHPYLKKQSLETWNNSRHIVVGQPGESSGPIEAKVKDLKLSRQVLCYAPNFNSALTLAADCDALFTTLQEPFCSNGYPTGLSPVPTPSQLKMLPAPAILTLRRDWGNPFELWLADLCNRFTIKSVRA